MTSLTKWPKENLKDIFHMSFVCFLVATHVLTNSQVNLIRIQYCHIKRSINRLKNRVIDVYSYRIQKQLQFHLSSIKTKQLSNYSGKAKHEELRINFNLNYNKTIKHPN